MNRTTPIGTALALLACLAAAAVAAPLKPERVAAEAKWVAHFDVDAARSSKVVGALFDECIAGKQGKGALKWLGERWGFQPQKELHALTLYGIRVAPGQFVAIVDAEMDKESIVDRFRKVSDPQTKEYHSHTIFTWTENLGKQKTETSVAFFKPTLAVVASGTELAQQALDVLRGEAAHLKADLPLAADTPPGTVFFARGVDLARNDFDCRPLDLVWTCEYTAAEHEGQWTEKLTMKTASERAAENFEVWFEGILAFAALHFQGAPKVIEVLNRAEIDTDDSTVSVVFETPIDPLVNAMPIFCEQARQYLQRRMAMCQKVVHYAERISGKKK